MKIERMLVAIIGATLGSLVAIWWVRTYGVPALPASSEAEPLAEIQLD